MSPSSGNRRIPDRRRETGRIGEDAAAAYLQREGYRIVARNWRCRSGEIDIIAEQGGAMIFVEVRTRRPTGTFGSAKESVDVRKQRQVREVAQVYLSHTKRYEVRLRFDVIAVELGADANAAPAIEHIENAF